jgi:glyoxylase-like metal-dependent hydrolase (beta-lactamase superfamily II)
MAGHRELNSVYLIGAAEPCLVEAGPGADGPTIVAGLRQLGLGPDDLAHVAVTHIHMDHAGGAGALLRLFPRATLWVHERGARHVVDPARLIASTARTYGERKMLSLYGETLPCDAGRVKSVTGGERIDLGDRALDVIHTPGHASYHVALHETSTGAMFTGEATGSYLPWADCNRPALPPPEVDVEQALDSIDTMRTRMPTSLLTSHFGAVRDVEVAFDEAVAGVVAWSEEVRRQLEGSLELDDDSLARALKEVARGELAAHGVELDRVIDRYDALGSIRMNAQGLARYWRKKWQAQPQDS